MRLASALVIAILSASSAFADEPAACYVNKDSTGDFVPEKLKSFAADPRVGTQITHKMNETNRASTRCIENFIKREGGSWPVGGAGILFGARISAAGKVTQVSVLESKGVNDGMLMACLGRNVCGWELEASEDGQEKLLVLPAFAIGGPRGLGNPRVGIN
jgi:hypothetical protein